MELMEKDREVSSPSRAELAAAVKREQEARVQRCKVRIEAALAEENCGLTAAAGLEEIAPGKFCIVTNPGIRAL